jgi:acyl carrier protein
MSNSSIPDSEVLEKFANIVAKSLHIDVTRVTADAYLDELGAESLDLIEITMETESAFNVWISEKTILHTAEEVFGPSVLQRDGVLTDAGKALLRHRMPDLDGQLLQGDVTIKDLNRLFLRVGTWVQMVEGLMEFTPKQCPKCGAGLEASVAFRMKCTQCGNETALSSGEELNRKWVQEYYQKEYRPAAGAAEVQVHGAADAA